MPGKFYTTLNSGQILGQNTVLSHVIFLWENQIHIKMPQMISAWAPLGARTARGPDALNTISPANSLRLRHEMS